MARRYKVDWEKHKALLGTMSDVDVGKKLGVGGVAVYYARKRYGIPSWGKSRKAHPRGVFWDSQPLGKVPDRLMAMMIDETVANIARARRVRGIRPYRGGQGMWINE